MEEEQTNCIVKIIYLISFAIVSSYCLYWGENEQTISDPVDETGWVPDGAFASMMDDFGGL